MKITIVLGAFLPVPPVMGGAIEKSWLALAQEFVSRNHDVTIISRALPQFARHEIVDGIRHLRLRGFDTPRSLLWLKILDLLYSLRVRRALPAADILVTNTFWLPLLIRDPSRGKIYVHVGRYPKGQMPLYGKAARLQTPSSDVADAIKGETPSSAQKVIAIPYPRPQTISAGAPPPLEARSKIVLYVGRVHPEKGVHVLVEAFMRLRRGEFVDWKLIIVGSTDSREGGGVTLICANCGKARLSRRNGSFFAGQSLMSQSWKKSFGLREFLLIPRWPCAAKLLASRRSKP